MGKLMHSRQKWLKNLLIRNFIRHYDVNMQLAEESNYLAYDSFNDFFTRKLKPHARPVTQGEWDIAAPVDGTLSEYGAITKGRLFQAKGLDYKLTELLAGDKELAKEFENGHFATFYLSPKDYHRVHMPLSGLLKSMIYVPGRLLSVNPNMTSQVPKIFVKNERVITTFETRLGTMAVIMIGAIFVGSISTVWAGKVTPPYGKEIMTHHYASSGAHSLRLERGQELARFNMGSTVIVLLPGIDVDWSSVEHEIGNLSVAMGQKVGQFLL